MTAETAVEFARELCDAEVRQYALDNFPGIADLRQRGVRDSRNSENVTSLVGTWHGVAISFEWQTYSSSGPGVDAYVVRRCRCCGLYSTWYLRGGGVRVETAKDLASFSGLPTTDSMSCSRCDWLHEAQVEAAMAHSKFSRWRFEKRRGESSDSVLRLHAQNKL